MIDDSKKRSSSILDALPFAAFVIGQDHKILHWNKLLESFTGLKAEKMLGTKQHWKAFYKSVRPCLADLLVDGKVEEIPNYYASKYAKFDLLNDAYEIIDYFPDLGNGGKWLRITATFVRNSLGKIVGAEEILEDISESKKADEELHLLMKLTQGIIKTTDFRSAIKFVLRSVCESTNWAYGEAWVTDNDGTALECLPAWYSSSPDKVKKFRQVSEETRFPANIGLPGRVWSSGSHEWIPNISISTDKIFLRTEVAAETGLKAALGIPIISDEKFLGVLVFFDFRTYQENNHQVELVSAVAAQLGEVIQRKRAYDSLLESEARLKKAEHLTKMGYWELDLVKNTLLWSDEVYRIFGLKPQEFHATYEAFLDNIHPDDRQFVNKAYMDSLKDRTTYNIVHRLLLKDGTLKYVSEQCETIFDDNGTPLRSMGTIQDITEIKQAEERIYHLNRVLRAIRNVNQLIIREKDRDDLIQQACAALIETGGYTTAWIALFDASGGFLTGAEAGFGRDFTSMLALLKRGDLPTCARSALAKSGLVEIIDPPSTCVDCSLSDIYSDNGRIAIRLEHDKEVYGVLVVSMLGKFLADEKEHGMLQEIAADIAFALYSIRLENERKQAQVAVLDSQERLNKILTSLPIGVSISNPEGSVSYVNRALWTIFGYDSEDDFIKVPTAAYYYNQKGRDIFLEAHKKGLVKGLEIRFKRKNNTMFWGSVSSTTLIARDGKPEFINAFEDITERMRAWERLNALNRAAVAMGTAQTQEEIFSTIAKELKQLNISCMLFPLDETQGKLFTRYLSFESSLLDTAEKLAGIKFQDFSFPIKAVEVFREVIRKKNTLITDNPEQALQKIIPKISNEIANKFIKTLHVQKMILAPLIVEDQVIGVFSIQSNTLTREDVPNATAFAHQLASAWNKTKLVQDLRRTLEGTIHTIAATVEARDPYTAGHQKRVADLAAVIAQEMKLSDDQVEGIKMAGIIHDLGKINVPAEILSKPGKLSDLEFQIIQTHPQVGFDLLKEIEFPWPIAEIIQQHHEKMDGSGYPQGLKGDEILLEARILAVADIVEAMSSHRPYRPALGIEKALTQIKKDKGTLLDPDVVDACLKVFEDGYKLPKG
ncbi:MAG: PAS domain S-box protein [Anaerolineaceae bacterium]|nr:PAS domain S-box protein [Anaerolineaceae bacterium]